MNADPAAQLALLDLQALDTELAQLAHRRRILPALAIIAERQKQAAELHLRTVEAAICTIWGETPRRSVRPRNAGAVESVALEMMANADWIAGR